MGHEFFEEKLTGYAGEEIILKNGVPAFSLCVVYMHAGLIFIDMRQTLPAKAVKDRICLLFIFPWLQLDAPTQSADASPNSARALLHR